MPLTASPKSGRLMSSPTSASAVGFFVGSIAVLVRVNSIHLPCPYMSPNFRSQWLHGTRYLRHASLREQKRNTTSSGKKVG